MARDGANGRSADDELAVIALVRKLVESKNHGLDEKEHTQLAKWVESHDAELNNGDDTENEFEST